MTLLLLLALSAFAADPTIVIPGASPAPETAPAPTVENHITVVRPGDGNALSGAMNFVVTISCQPGKPSKFDYLPPGIADYTSENAAFRTAAEARSDIHLVANVQNATPEETIAWFTALHEEFDEPVRQMIVTVSCPAWGGDQDEELLLMNGGTLPFTDLLTAVAPIARSSIWILDASRNVSGALAENVSSLGPTADDVVKYGIVPDAFAVSSSAPGKYGGPGLIGAAAKVLGQSKGGAIDLQGFYHGGIKPAVPALELFTSMGVMEPDAWSGNLARPILIGGPLIVPVAGVKPPAERKKVPTGCWVAGGGVLSMIAGSVFAIEAANHHATLVDYNEFGGETQEELDTEVGAYRLNTGLAIGFGGLGVLATAGGVTWTVLDKDKATVTIVPTGTGVAVTGSW